MNPAYVSESSLGTVELRIPSKAEWVAVARLAVAAVANRLQFSIEEIEDVKLAVAEACTNCIQHAAGGQRIDITCETFPDGLTIRVRDFALGSEGSPTGPRRLSDAHLGGGLGVFLIRSLMDSVEYEVDPERGTNLVMTKKVSA